LEGEVNKANISSKEMLNKGGTSIKPRPCINSITPIVMSNMIIKDKNQNLLEAIGALVLYICIIAVNLQEN